MCILQHVKIIKLKCNQKREAFGGLEMVLLVGFEMVLLVGFEMVLLKMGHLYKDNCSNGLFICCHVGVTLQHNCQPATEFKW